MTTSAEVPEALGEDLGPELLAVVAKLHRWATRHASLPISPALARLLAQIEEQQPSRIGDLARADRCSQPTMTVQVQRLEELGLVRRTPDPSDSRAVLVSVTAAGSESLAQMRAARAAALAPMLDKLGAPDRRRLGVTVRIMREMLENEEDAR